MRVVDVRPLARPMDDLERECRQMRAGEVRREVGRREREGCVVEESHGLSIGPASARSYTGGTISVL